MKIVVLDGFCLNPGDLSWDGLRRLGEVEVFDRTAPEEVAGRIAGAAAVFTNKTRLTAAARNNEESNRLVNEQIEVGMLAAVPGVLATESAALLKSFFLRLRRPAADLRVANR